MKLIKILRWSAITLVCSLILSAGCAQVGEETAKPQVKPVEQPPKAKTGEAAVIALKFSPNDVTTYKVITEAERSIKWEGSVPDDPAFKGGRNHDRTEMTFTQEIKSVDDAGNAVAKITFKELKMSSVVKDSAAFEFDSANPKDPNHPLAMLIGKSYTIKIAPTGEVIEVLDIKDAETAARMGSVVPVKALRLLKPEVIKDRHATLVLPDTDKSRMHIGDSWSRKKTFSFGMMGAESYEKIYTPNKIKDSDNHRIAIIGMNSIPASGTSKDQAAGLIKGADNIETYAGELELDLTAGKIRKYFEKLHEEWTTAFPGAEQGENAEPAILTMSSISSYSLEKID
ncbi:MAG: hypothetical protein JW947_03340 [Sedimentisphaerales bacterium]|nr:hypothetical protein [Sedimentisphaerales bacterium]